MIIYTVIRSSYYDDIASCDAVFSELHKAQAYVEAQNTRHDRYTGESCSIEEHELDQFENVCPKQIYRRVRENPTERGLRLAVGVKAPILNHSN